MKNAFAFAAVAACLAAPACSGRAGEADAPAVAEPSARIPGEAPGIVGQVREVNRRAEASVVLVEQDPARSAGQPAAWITIHPYADVLRRRPDGSTARAAAAEVTVGARVQVWFSGPVLESYPVQATAGTVLIES